MKKWKKMLMAAVVAGMAVGFICASAVTTFAAEGVPELYSDTLWVKSPNNYLTNEIVIENREVKEDMIKSATSSKPAILTVKKMKVYDEVCWMMLPKKVGTAKVTVNCTVGDKDYTLTATYKVKKYPKAIKKLKINGKTVKVTAKKKPWEANFKKYKKKYVKVKITPKKGWKIDRVDIFMGNNKGLEKDMKLKTKVIKKGSKIKFPKKYTHANLAISLRQPKTGDYFFYYINFYR